MNQKLVSTLFLSLGIIIGVSGTLGWQSLLSSSMEGSSIIDSSMSPRPQFTGFSNQGKTQENITYETYQERFYDDGYPTSLIGNYDQVIELSNGTFFTTVNDNFIQGDDQVYFTKFSHHEQDGDVIWEFDIMPSGQFMEQASLLTNYFDMTIDIDEIHFKGNTVILLLEIANYYSVYNDVTSNNENFFVGGQFSVLGANAMYQAFDIAVSVTLDLSQYLFRVEKVIPLSDFVGFSWGDLFDYGPYFMTSMIFELLNTNSPVIVLEGLRLDPLFRYHHFFISFTLDNQQNLVFESHGEIKTNLILELNLNNLINFDGTVYRETQHIHHISFQFVYLSFLTQWINENHFAIEFSGAFNLITEADQNRVISFYESFDWTDRLSYANASLHYIFDANMNHVIFFQPLTWFQLDYQPDHYENVFFSYLDHNNFIVNRYEEDYTYTNEGLRLLKTESIIEWYKDSQLQDVIEFKDSNQLAVNSIIKLEDGFIVSGYTSMLDHVNYDGNLDLSLAILIIDNEGNLIDGELIETRYNAWIFEMRIEESNLYIVFSTNSNEPLFEDLNTLEDTIYLFMYPLLTE